jgi:hypothetical protein
MNPRATRHIVPPQACGYSNRSNRERRESRHPAIASRRLPSTRTGSGVSRAPRVRARAVNLVFARCLFWGRCRSCGSAVNAAGGTGRTTGGARRRPGGQGSAGLRLRHGFDEGPAAEGGLADLGGDVVTNGADKVAPLQRSANPTRSPPPRSTATSGWPWVADRPWSACGIASVHDTHRVLLVSFTECRRGLGRSTTDLQQGHLPCPAFSRALLRCTNCLFAGISRWRDPDSNRGHHDFQEVAVGRYC